MSKLEVTLSKFKKFIDHQGGFDFEQDGNRVVVSFVPAFPEALEKGWDSPPPRVMMHGEIIRGKINFDEVFVEDNNQVNRKDIELAEYTYRGWLQFIEDNY